jgi:hypothetical protein
VTYTRYHTKSGSIYDVAVSPDRQTFVRRMAGGDHYKGRCDGPAWKPAVQVCAGSRLAICWGSGRDEYSPDDGYDGPRVRWTETSKIVRSEQVEDAAATLPQS